MAEKRYDAIVVGARCAGSPTAILLGPQGLPGPGRGPGEAPQRHHLDQSRPPTARGGAPAVGPARPYDQLWRCCAGNLDELRERMGQWWELFCAYSLDRALTPIVQTAPRALTARFGGPPIPAAELASIAVPPRLIWGSGDLATLIGVAEDASVRYGWPLHVIENLADDPPIEAPAAFPCALHSPRTPRSALTSREEPS